MWHSVLIQLRSVHLHVNCLPFSTLEQVRVPGQDLDISYVQGMAGNSPWISLCGRCWTFSSAWKVKPTFPVLEKECLPHRLTYVCIGILRGSCTGSPVCSPYLVQIKCLFFLSCIVCKCDSWLDHTSQMSFLWISLLGAHTNWRRESGFRQGLDTARPV